MPTSTDSLYASPMGHVADFTFDDKVVRVFPDMIRRSVPGYATIISMTGLIAERYAQPGSRLYDLGCSLGASLLAMRHRLGERDCRLVGVDNSPAMLEQARRIIEADPDGVAVELVDSDARDLPLEDASVVVMNFTLQFIPPADRPALLRKIHQAMRPGGVLILSEKIAFADPHLQQLNTELHHAFKRANGYSDLEIAQKRQAIENVMIPETLDTHRQRLRDTGFASVDVWFQCFNFASLVAIKS